MKKLIAIIMIVFTMATVTACDLNSNNSESKGSQEIIIQDTESDNVQDSSDSKGESDSNDDDDKKEEEEDKENNVVTPIIGGGNFDVGDNYNK